jgi:ribosomal protein S18 acetylase RimI-like enzyme
MTTSIRWRGDFRSLEANILHAQAFNTREYGDEEWDWVRLVTQHSLGWVTARQDRELVGFVNVLTDGLVHAWIQDVMVATAARHQGIGRDMVRLAREKVAEAGCDWLHVDFDPELADFYYDACGFTPSAAGVIALSEDRHE